MFFPCLDHHSLLFGSVCLSCLKLAGPRESAEGEEEQ